MGVYRNDFILIGAKLPKGTFDWEKHEDHMGWSGPGDLGVLDWSPMTSDDDDVAGMLIAQGDEYEGFGYLELDPMSPDEWDEKAAHTKEWILETFGVELEPKLVVFSRFG